MKKLLLTAAAAAMIFTSCKKYEVSKELDLDSLPKVTLKGTVYAHLDETVPVLQFAPEGTKVLVSIPYAAYDATNASAGNYVVETTINSQGVYAIDVPTVSTGVDVTISFTDFTANVKKLDSVGQEVNILQRFTCPNRVVNKVGNGVGKIEYTDIDARYASVEVNPNDSSTFVPTGTVQVSGKFEYLKYDSTSRGTNPGNAPTQYSWDAVPITAKIIAVITLTDGNGRKFVEKKPVTVEPYGAYRITVPMVERGKAVVHFYSEDFWTMYVVIDSDTKRQLWRHELDDSLVIYNVPVQPKKDLKYMPKVKINDED